MRLHRLELTGFGPFRETQTVDFDALAADGIFLISGRTGAGKSSILDGVTFALYGGVPRYDGGDKRIRSDHSELGDPTAVVLEFTVGARRWRVTRSPEYERPARRGGGLTTEVARAELEEWVDGGWLGRAGRPRDVALLLDEILGLNQSQFQQVILLAQNRFSRFLLANNNERQALLRTLFDSRRFEQYRDELDLRRREALRDVDETSAQLRTLLEMAEARASGDDGSEAPAPETFAARIDAIERAESRAQYRAETRQRERADAVAAFDAAAAAHQSVLALARSQEEAARLRIRVAELDAERESVQADEARLRDAHAAEVLRPFLDAFERAEVREQDARRTQTTAAEAWGSIADRRAALIGPGDDPADVAERLTGEIAKWRAAQESEREAAEAEAEAEAAGAQADRADRDLAEISQLRAAIPDEVALLDARMIELAARAAALDAARQAAEAASSRLAAAVEAEALERRLHESARHYEEAAEASAAASRAVADLLRRRLQGFAGELAARLTPGEPCPVCGAVEHPHPASSDVADLGEDAFAAAERRRDAAATAEREASAAMTAAQAAYTAAFARAGGATAADLEAELAGAQAAVQDAAEAEAQLAEVRVARIELSAQDAAAAARSEELAALSRTAREQLTRLQERASAARTIAAEARGDHPSVTDRIVEAEAVRDRARASVAAADAASHAATELADARQRRDAELAASPFGDEAAARAALLDPAALSALRTRVADHAAEVSASRRRLLELELELAGIAESDLDPTAAREALDRAALARDAAVTAEEAARGEAAALADLRDRIGAAHTSVAELIAEAEAITRLADTVAGRAPNTMKMDLETFVLAAELEEIVAAANVRLGEMSDGRYRLQHSDARAARGSASGLGIEVMDAHTGRARPPQSLSGGETFLASLALALGLAEVVTARAGGIRLDTLFVDEGFGSLDAETLESAMRTLDDLRAGGRAVGVISHVEAMQAQLPARLHVTATPGGPSVITQDTPLAV